VPVPKLPSATYEIRSTFDAPLPFSFRWCTDYTPGDARLSGEEFTRRILQRSARRVVYQDLEDQPDGWHWTHSEITLHPPNHWHAEITGSHRCWKIDYRLRELPDGRTELWFRGRRTPTAIGRRNPSQAELCSDLRTLWKNYGTALARDYHRGRSRHRSSRT
jgi:hypothetical protein